MPSFLLARILLFFSFLSHRLCPVLFLFIFFPPFFFAYSDSFVILHLDSHHYTSTTLYVSTMGFCFVLPLSHAPPSPLSSSTSTNTRTKTLRCFYKHGLTSLALSIHFQSFFVVSFSLGHPSLLGLIIRGGSHLFNFFHCCHTFHFHSTLFFAHLSSASLCSIPPPFFLSFFHISKK